MSNPYGSHPQTAPQYRPAPRNGYGITALVLSLIGLVFCLTPLTGFIGLILGLVATLFGFLGLGRVRRGEATNRKLTVAALILAILTAVAGFFAMKLFFDAVSDFGKSTSPPAAVGGDPAAAEEAGAATTTGAASQFAAGQSVDRDGVQITAAQLRKVKPEYGSRQLCSKVTYRNTGGDPVSFNVFDWKIQDPSGVRSSPTYSGTSSLSSGQLAPGGTVAGDVCIDDPGTAGEYLVVNEAFLSDQIEWKASR